MIDYVRGQARTGLLLGGLLVAGCASPASPPYEPWDGCVIPGVEAADDYILVRVAGDDTVRIAGESTSPDDYASSFEELAGRYPDAAVLIFAEPSSKAGLVLEVMDVLKEVEELNLALISARGVLPYCEQSATGESEG